MAEVYPTKFQMNFDLQAIMIKTFWNKLESPLSLFILFFFHYNSNIIT